MKYLMILSVITSIMLNKMKHPLSMGFMLMTQMLILGLMSGMMIKMFWFSYILIMTLLSGMMILFIYMASIASNELFKYSPTSYSYSALFPLFVMILIVSTAEKNVLTPQKIMMKDMELYSLNKLFEEHNMMITIAAIVFLFVTMIMVTNIINSNEGPLRQKN